MKLRIAKSDDEQWINERYASVHFQPSDLSRDLIIIAEIDGVAAAREIDRPCILMKLDR